MGIRCLLSLLMLTLFLAGCTPVRRYTETVKNAFDPQWRQQRLTPTPAQKERLCGTSVC